MTQRVVARAVHALIRAAAMVVAAARVIQQVRNYMPEEIQPAGEVRAKNYVPLYVGFGTLGVLVIIAVGYAGTRLIVPPELPPISYTSENTTFDVLSRTNTAFTDATALADAGQFELAKTKYQEALSGAVDSQQRAQIKYKMVSMDELLGNYSGAISGYKALVSDPDAYDYVQAYAIQSLGLMYYTFGHDHPEILSETFTGEPYASFRIKGESVNAAYRRLFEYGSTFKPLAYAEARIADWYVREAVRMQESGASETDIARIVTLVKASLGRMDADLERIQEEPNEKRIVPTVILRKAEVLGRLSRLGEATTNEAEAAYQQAVALAALGGPGNDGFARFNYAMFLSQAFSELRRDDIVSLLQPFYEQPDVYASSPATGFIRSQRAEVSSLQHTTILDLAKLDDGFKEHLMSLGWTSDLFE